MEYYEDIKIDFIDKNFTWDVARIMLIWVRAKATKDGVWGGVSLHTGGGSGEELTCPPMQCCWHWVTVISILALTIFYTHDRAGGIYSCPYLAAPLLAQNTIYVYIQMLLMSLKWFFLTLIVRCQLVTTNFGLCLTFLWYFKITLMTIWWIFYTDHAMVVSRDGCRRTVV